MCNYELLLHSHMCGFHGKINDYEYLKKPFVYLYFFLGILSNRVILIANLMLVALVELQIRSNRQVVRIVD